ncbi:MAG: HEAT repeat domain-containing protein [Planctomycetes bacterium]|nr:HEAT repeat domain-containing protein [Planctomycetota bacterium]
MTRLALPTPRPAHATGPSRSTLFFVTVAAIAWAVGAAAPPLAADPKPFGDETFTRHFPRLRTYDVRHYAIRLAFDPAHGAIQGEVAISFRPLHPAFSELKLDCSELHVTAAAGADGAALKFTHEKDTLAVQLGRTFGPGDETTVTITYDGRPRKGIYFVRPDAAYPGRPLQLWTQGEDEDTHYWVPCYDFPNDLATSECRVTVPAGQVAIGNGKLAEIATNPDGTRTFHWKEEVPHVSYLLSVVAGEFTEHRADAAGLPLLYVVPGSTIDADTVARSFGKTPDMIAFFAARIGRPFPFEKYAQCAVHDFLFGGMENASATTLTANTLHDARAHGEESSEGLVAHELAHQWWGDLLTCADWSHIWLNEGFATYFAALYTEHAAGADDFRLEMQGNLDAYLGEDGGEYRRPIVCDRYAEPMDLFDSHAYSKGALVLHYLRFVLGDAAWWKGIALYAARHGGTNVTTGDFRKAMEESSGKDLGWFFDQWLYRGGHPAFAVSWDWDEERKLVGLHVRQTQKADDLTPIFRVPVDVEFVTPKGKTPLWIEVTQPEMHVVMPLDAKPLLVAFDKYGWVPKTLDFPKAKEEYLYQAANDDDVLGRIQALRQLGARLRDDGDAQGRVAESLAQDAYWGARRAAAGVLGEMKGEKALTALAAAVEAEADARVRHAIADALGNFTDERAFAPLRKRRAEDTSYGVRAAALAALVRGKAPDAAALCRAALDEASHHEAVRNAALAGLLELDAAAGLETAWNQARYGNVTHARGPAVSALAHHRKEDPAVTDFLMGLLDDPYYWTRESAANALKDRGDTRAIPALEKFLAGTVDGRLRKAATRALRQLREGSEARRVEGLRTEAKRLETEAVRKEAEAETRRAEAEEARARARKARAEAERIERERGVAGERTN